MANYVTRNGREYIFSFVRDITGRKQAEAALRESEEKYRTLVEVNRDIIYSLRYRWDCPVCQPAGHNPARLPSR